MFTLLYNSYSNEINPGKPFLFPTKHKDLLYLGTKINMAMASYECRFRSLYLPPSTQIKNAINSIHLDYQSMLKKVRFYPANRSGLLVAYDAVLEREISIYDIPETNKEDHAIGVICQKDIGNSKFPHF